MAYPITIDATGLLRVEVYWNLSKRCWSIRHCHGKLIADRPHRSALSMADVLWNVQPGGQERVRSEKRKNVHAVGRGWLLEVTHGPDGYIMNDEQERSAHTSKIVYDPYTMDGFQTSPTPWSASDEPRPVYFSDRVTFYTRNGSPLVYGYRNIVGPKIVKMVSERHSDGTGEMVHYELRSNHKLYVVGKDDDLNPTGFEIEIGSVMHLDGIDTAIFNHEEEMMYLMQQAREEFGA